MARTVGALIMREVSSTYGKRVGGYLWVILEPIAGIVLLTLIFSVALRTPPIGTSFAVFYATGLMPFMFYGTLSAAVASSISFSKPLLSYPAITVTDAIISRALVNSITGLLVGYILFSILLGIEETRTNPQIGQIALAYGMAFVLALGVGSVNAFLFAALPEWQSLWIIVNRPLMIVSCVLFMYDDVPHPYDDYLWWNPLIHVVGQMRKGFYLTYPGDYISPVYVFSVGLVLWVIGTALLLRYHREILFEW
ncbi:ABC transporter permease [Paracoccus shandongensis]|uniref:ABC transporter permease n=1 Tax=Paracoccus shandongensis TaxID=2816048 RepID=UPI001A8BFCDD|nr:ABC transporter permease [Paracoccus shandongensis]